ncbi:MAG TPA: BT4734/BF3469 family protein [Verrucomicrobiae bacterium]|jgi:hypothetical protein|nr:BT4734/BF3469 family protein [Verrucomicrobiae bacterium]
MTCELSNVHVAMFVDAYGVEPKEATLGAILDAIRGPKYAKKTQRARALFSEWKAVCPDLDSKESPEAKAYDTFKKTFPAFCISGTAKSRTEPLEHSRLLQVDCDKLNRTLDTLRAKLKADKHVAFGFVSPSGEGLKLGLAIDGTRHAESFEAAQRYFREQYGVEIDPKVKDRLRLCFVCHDPDLWTRPDAETLAISELEKTPEPSVNHGGALNIIVLPTHTVSISDSARGIFQHIAPTKTFFWRGGAMVELVEQGDIATLEVIRPDAFRSRVERFGNVFAWRAGANSEPVLKPAKLSRDDATAIMATVEARELLPPVVSVLRCPVLIETDKREVVILGRGYHAELGGLLIVDGDTPPRVELSEAVASLKWLIEEFDFQSEGDKSRALAAFLTPALRLGGFLRSNIPIDVAEADMSQAGKGYRHNIACALYNESGYFVTARKGGVGSTDESFDAALIAGRPFVCLDNFRGQLDSQHLEAFLTCPTSFPVRIPYHGEILVDPKRFILQMTSNGVEATRDLANRAGICRIRKRSGFRYRDTLGELQRRQPYFLGCVFSILAAWIGSGKPKSADSRHDFREWNQTLDWIIQKLLDGAPLMDGHEAAQERVSNPALSWLRTLALAVSQINQLGKSFTTSELVELCDLQGLVMPGNPKNGDEAKKHAGRLFSRLFMAGDKVDVDGFIVTRSVQRQSRGSVGGAIASKNYTFAKP